MNSPVQDQDKDLALQAPVLNSRPEGRYAESQRTWQGIPGLERSARGRLWAVWYSGGKAEGPDNYVLLVSSEDDGQTWSKPKIVIDPPDKVRAFDPVLWIDPSGRLWLFWAQSYDWFDGRCGVWATVTDAPDASLPQWSAPQRIANGVMMNKPIALSNGEWLAPCAVWSRTGPPYDVVRRADMAAERFSNVYSSDNAGLSWMWRGAADAPNRTFDEHSVVQKRDGTLLMYIRTADGIAQSFSSNLGRAWTPGKMTRFTGVDSRAHLRRLNSGNLLLIYHDSKKIRRRLAAWLSDDDGDNWHGPILLDERDKVSYPDAIQAPDGRIFVIYDRDRQGAGEILMSVFREEDVRSGRTPALKTTVVSRLRAT